VGRDAAHLAINNPRKGGIKHSDGTINGQTLQRVARERVRKRKVVQELGRHKREIFLEVVQDESIGTNCMHKVRKIDVQHTGLTSNWNTNWGGTPATLASAPTLAFARSLTFALASTGRPLDLQPLATHQLQPHIKGLAAQQRNRAPCRVLLLNSSRVQHSIDRVRRRVLVADGSASHLGQTLDGLGVRTQHVQRRVFQVK
jgi:hypothetical protein